VEDQKIELIDYLRVIWKRKRLIIRGTFLAAAASLAVSVSMPNLYEVSRTLRIGLLPESAEEGKLVKGRQVESREDFIDRLKDHRMLGEAVKELQLGMSPKEVADLISIDTKPNPHVRYKVQAADVQVATRIADWLAESVIKAHKPIFDRWFQVTKENEEELVAKINSLEAENRKMKGILERTAEGQSIDTTAVVVLHVNIGDRERNLTDLRKELARTRLSRVGHNNTVVIAAHTMPRQPFRTRVGLNLALGGTLGLMISIFLAFFLEYVERAKSKESVVRSEESRGRTQE